MYHKFLARIKLFKYDEILEELDSGEELALYHKFLARIKLFKYDEIGLCSAQTKPQESSNQ